MTWDEIPGWMNYEALYSAVVNNLPPRARVVEVGCWLGSSLAYLATRAKESGRRVEVFGVDPGFGSEGAADESLHKPVLEECGGNTTGRLLANLRACGVIDIVTVIAAPSLKAAKLFPDESLDFVFVDGDHRKEAVAADLKAWWPKIAPGGLLAGHDYDVHWPSVVEAVNEHFGREVPDPVCSHCWSVQK